MSEWHVYYDYLEEYDEYTVLRMLANGENLWTPLIQPDMYQQALNEFMKMGKFIKFPTKHIYQWMGIIMKNTAIIRAITSIAGHDMGYPTDAIIDACFSDSEEFEDYKRSLEHKGNFSPDFGWMENDEEDDGREVDDEEAACQYLEDNGFYEKMTLPDGSDAWSDYGIRSLEEIILEYNDSLEPEKVLVLVNRALDVGHQRGDLASAFIVGGSSTLSKISNKGYVNESQKQRKRIFLSESQVEEIKKELEKARKDTNTNPTEGQKEAGNYKKGKVNIYGFEIAIENPKGSYRRGKNGNGKEWKNLMKNDYGYFTHTKAVDGDAVDVFLGKDLDCKTIFAIDQKMNGKFDETKIMFGFKDKEAAKKAYLSNYSKDWKGFWKITEVSIDDFKEWLYDGYKQRKPFSEYVGIKKVKLR